MNTEVNDYDKSLINQTSILSTQLHFARLEIDWKLRHFLWDWYILFLSYSKDTWLPGSFQNVMI